jgi:hypothetical protein
MIPEPARDIRAGVHDGIFIPRTPVDPAVLDRIREGFLRSPFVTPALRDYVGRQPAPNNP